MKRIEDQRPRRRLAKVLLGSSLILIGVAGVLAGIGWVKYRQIQAAMAAPPPPMPPVAVVLRPAQAVTFRRNAVVVGTVLAPQSIRLRTELTGVITEVAASPGQTVRAGDLLLKLDTRTEQAELKSARATSKLAAAEMNRARRLASANANSAQEVDLAAAQLARSEADVERLNVMIDRKTLRAPFDARVGLFDLHVGQYLEQGTEITTLEGIDDYLHIDFAMPAHVADTIRVGDDVRFRDTVGGGELAARIIAIDSSADAVSRSVTARARLDNPPPSLQPNDSVRIVVDYGPEIEAVAVPATAIRREPSGTLVFVAAAADDGTLIAQARVVVIAGSGDNGMAWIARGVAAGETVVAGGSFKVTEGAMLADVPQTTDADAAAPTIDPTATDPSAAAADAVIDIADPSESVAGKRP